MRDTISVTSADDVRVADFRRLSETAGHRAMERGGYFVSEGWVSIERLIDSGHVFRSVLLSPSRVKRFRPFLERAELRDVPVFVAEHDVMRSIVGFDLPRGVLMSAARRPMPSVLAIAANSRWVVVLDGLIDDQSVGAIARAARAFDVDALVLSPDCTDPYHRRTVRVSMGEILHLPVARTTADEWPGVLEVLHRHGFESWAMASSAPGDENEFEDEAVWDIAPPERLALVIGDHGGLDADLVAAATRRVTVPHGATAPLGAGQFAAITLAAASSNRRR